MFKITKVPKFQVNTPSITGALIKIASEVQRKIKNRTLSGKDVKNSPFIAYSEGTKAYKGKIGKTGNTVQLRDKGTMLESIRQVKVNAEHIKIYIGDANRAMVGAIHQTGAGNMPQREWWGVSQQDADAIYLKYMKPISPVVAV